MYLSTEQLIPLSPLPSLSPYSVETLLEQGSSEFNEDVLLETDNLFGVFDGATSLDKRRCTNGLTGGLMAAMTAAEVFSSQQHSLYQLAEVAEVANTRIRERLIAEDIPLAERHRLWSTSMAVIRMGRNSFEYCQTGDALILLIFSDGNYRIVTPDCDIDRETLHLWKEHPAPDTGPIHHVLAEQIHRIRLQMNNSYGVLNGEPEAIKFIRHGQERLNGVTDILLFTDGLFLPKENPLEETDWQTFVTLYRQGGLQAVRDHVRSLQSCDPNLKKYPRFKLHDDIAAVAVSL